MEEKLNKFKRNFIIKQLCTGVFIFMWFYPLAFGLIDEKQWFTAGLIVLGVIIAISLLTVKRTKEKQKETLRIMPMIISIKDTVESLKKERLIYNVIYVIMFACGLTFVRSNILRLPSCIMLALSSLFMDFANLTTQKIKYLENKPEGL